MKLTNLKIILLTLLISACSSVPEQEIQYYLLNQQGANNDKVTDVDNKKSIQIDLTKIQLPEYLTQPYLVIQLNQHQLHYARFHLWAEGLQTGIAKALLTDLNNADGLLQFNSVIQNDSSIDSNKDSLTLEINHFYPTNQSKVVLSGNFSLINSKGKLLIPSSSFSFEEDLIEDGYQHSVSAMRKLVTQLSQLMITKISPMNTNTSQKIKEQ